MRAWIGAALLCLWAATAAAETRVFAWTPVKGAVSHRLYRATGTGPWKLIAENPQPSFVLDVSERIGVAHEHWQAVDVLPDGTEVRQKKYGWWTR